MSDLVTLEDVKESIPRIPAHFTDGLLQKIIDRAEARVRAYCRWHVFPEVTESVTLNGNGAESVLLRSLNVTDVAEVVVDGVALSPDEFVWSSEGLLRRNSLIFTDSLRNIQVTLTHGFSVDDLAALQEVIIGMIERVVKLPHFIKQSATGDASVTYGVDAALRPTFGDKEVLDEYRLVR